jgi:hypothetical protein
MTKLLTAIHNGQGGAEPTASWTLLPTSSAIRAPAQEKEGWTDANLFYGPQRRPGLGQLDAQRNKHDPLAYPPDSSGGR